MIKPINKKLILSPSASRMRGMLFIPDIITDNSGTCLVVETSGDLTIPVRKGDTVIAQTNNSKRNSIVNKTFFADQNQILAVIANKQVFPMGKVILIKRDIKAMEAGGIYIPENRRSQSLGGWVHKLGIVRKRFFTSVIPGDYVLLNDWNENMVEIQLEDGSYGLIVRPSDLLAKVKRKTKVEHKGKIYVQS